MSWSARTLLPLLLVSMTLAGCADSEPTDSGDDLDAKVEATETTGGIRGVVVDETIVPIEGVTVKVIGTEMSTETDAEGLFIFSGLEPGFYFLNATHPFYSSSQVQAQVEANVAEPPAVRVQLVREVFDTPRAVPLQMDGYIFCSTNSPAGLSEECGEGVGSPETTCSIPEAIFGTCFGAPPVDNPVMPGERIGKNDQNMPGQEWYVDDETITEMVIEQYWKPSIQASADNSGRFRTFVAVDWICDPFCRADHRFADVSSASPLRYNLVVDDHVEALEAKGIGVNATTRFTTFTYAADNPGILLEQSYQQFVTLFYVLPAPEGWNVDEYELPY